MRLTRLITPEDAPVLAELLRANRDFLAPWEPVRSENYFTVAGQRAVAVRALARYEQGLTVPRVILDEAGQVAGRVNLVRGAFQSASLGYWLSAAANGRGLATAAVRDMIRVAFGELGLHRVEAATLLDNFRSQRVLERCGFVHFGVALSYLNIAGKWQDHALYQLLNDDLG
jgi:ribosomal-protein-alanine N-acetyltransferase